MLSSSPYTGVITETIWFRQVPVVGSARAPFFCEYVAPGLLTFARLLVVAKTNLRRIRNHLANRLQMI